MNKHVFLLIVVVVVCVFGFVFFAANTQTAAKPQFNLYKIVNQKTGNTINTVMIPDHVEVKAPNMVYIGEAEERGGGKVQGYAFIDYKDEKAKPGEADECGNGVCDKAENARKCPVDCSDTPLPEPDGDCYTFIGRAAKWLEVENYVVNPVNRSYMDPVMVRSILSSGVQKWESAAGQPILGQEVSGLVDGEDWNAPDGKNEVFFANIDEPGAIGITIVWGVFTGAPKNQKIVEWDQVYDDVDYAWAVASGTPNAMDFENIATHELGHSIGMGDLYDSPCSEATMYGYATGGETKKSTLEAGDIAGAAKLYR